MAHCAFHLAILLPILVAAAHIFGTGQLPVSSSSSVRRQSTTSSSPRHQPPGTTAVSASFHHQTTDTGDVSSFFADRHQPPPEPKLEPQPAVLEDLVKRGSRAMDLAERLDHLAEVLEVFGYSTMASAAPLLADSWILSIWSAPITVFAIPDASFDEACPGCPLRFVMLKHLAFGAHSFSKLSSRPSIKLITPVFKLCMSSKTTIIWSPVGGVIAKVVSINNVNIISPELYNDSRLVIHGMKGYIHLPAQGSCTRDVVSL